MTEKTQLNPFVKLALDIGPLILFFVVNGKAGIFAATGAFMVAVVIALAVSYVLIRRFPVMTVVSAVIVMVFGSLTIFLHDDTFIKMKPTLIYLLFAGVTGLVMTKLDGTARGGILVAIAEKFRLPVHFIGVGEGVEDLQPFAARDFARAVAGLEE